MTSLPLRLAREVEEACHPLNRCRLCRDVLLLRADGEELLPSSRGLPEHEQCRRYLPPTVQPFGEELVRLHVAKVVVEALALGGVIQPVQSD